MQKLIYGAAALALLTACGGGGDKPPKIEASPEDVAAALADMSLDTSEAGLVRFSGSKVSNGSASFDGFSVMLDEEDGLELTAGKLSLAGLHMTEKGANFTSMVFEDIKLTDEDEQATLTASGLTIDQPSPALSAWMADLMTTGEPDGFPPLTDLAFKGMSIGDMKFVASEEDDVDVDFSFGNLSMADFDQGALGNLSLDTLSMTFVDTFEGTNVSASMDSYDIDGLKKTQAEVISTVIALADDEDAMIEALGDIIGQNALDPGYERSALKNLKLAVNGLNFDLPSLVQTADYNNQGVATATETKPFKMTMNIDPAGQLGAQVKPVMDMLELDSLVIGGAGKAKIDSEADRIDAQAKDNYIEIDNLVKLSFGMDLSGIAAFNQSLMEATAQGVDEDQAMLGAASSLSIGRFQLALKDSGLYEKGLTLAGTMNGQDPEVLKAQAQGGVAFIPALAAQAGVDMELASELSGALATFLQDPGTLTLKLDPSEPLTVQSFMDPTAITKEKLGFSATAN